MSAWDRAVRLLVEVDVKAKVNQMMGTRRFRDLVELAKAEGYTKDDSYAAAAALSAMVVYDDPKRQAQYVKAYFLDRNNGPAPGDDEPW